MCLNVYIQHEHNRKCNRNDFTYINFLWDYDILNKHCLNKHPMFVVLFFFCFFLLNVHSEVRGRFLTPGEQFYSTTQGAVDIPN